MKFEEYEGELEYKNPYKSSNATRPIFKRMNPKVFRHKNGMIVKVHSKQYDYLVDGELITQRMGAVEELLVKLIETKVKAGDYKKLFKIDKEL